MLYVSSGDTIHDGIVTDVPSPPITTSGSIATVLRKNLSVAGNAAYISVEDLTERTNAFDESVEDLLGAIANLKITQFTVQGLSASGGISEKEIEEYWATKTDTSIDDIAVGMITSDTDNSEALSAILAASAVDYTGVYAATDHTHTDLPTGPTGPSGTNGTNGVDGGTGPTGPSGPTGAVSTYRKSISVYFPNTAATGTNVAAWRAGETMEVTGWIMGCVSGPGPSGPTCYLDVHKNGTSLWSTQSNRPGIQPGATGATGGAPNTTTIEQGSSLAIDIDSVGSTNAANGISLTLTYMVTP
jgi:hypothetical protein